MITVTITGEPHPQRRPRAVRMGPHVRMHEHKSDTAWKKDAAKQILCQLPVDGLRPIFRSKVPLKVSLLFVFSCPKSDHRKREAKPVRWHIKTRDLDNLEKAVLDAANGILWEDDGQIALMYAGKIIGMQGEPPSTIMIVEEIDESPLETLLVKAGIQDGPWR